MVRMGGWFEVIVSCGARDEQSHSLPLLPAGTPRFGGVQSRACHPAAAPATTACDGDRLGAFMDDG